MIREDMTSEEAVEAVERLFEIVHLMSKGQYQFEEREVWEEEARDLSDSVVTVIEREADEPDEIEGAA